MAAQQRAERRRKALLANASSASPGHLPPPLYDLKHHPSIDTPLNNDLLRSPRPPGPSHRHCGGRHASTLPPHSTSPPRKQRGPPRCRARCGRLAAPLPLPSTALAHSPPSSGVAASLRAWIRGTAAHLPLPTPAFGIANG
ncbi:hypothetical protein K523DRAFT_358408 [Schizophyllum commune Tattone D]|nr:hypothetical protein K523DRAFT_358408 [Schizophyllum commune Tattone D]